MTTTHHVIDGVDTEQLAGFAEFAADNPAEVQFELGASSTYEGTCAHSLAKVDAYTLGDQEISRETREYTIPFGAWRDVLETAGWVGPTDRIEPIEAALAALASCINVGISINAVANGVDIEHLRTRVRTDFDPAVLFSLEDLDAVDTVFEHVTAEIEIEGADVPTAEVREWARRAPVFTLISLANDIDITVETAAEVAADD